MNVITEYPIYVNNELVKGEDFYALDELPTKGVKDIIKPTLLMPTQTEIAKAKKEGINWDKINGWMMKGKTIAQDSGILDILKNKLGIPVKPAPAPSPPITPTIKEEKAQGLSMNSKILIGVGVVLVLGTAIIFSTKKK